MRGFPIFCVGIGLMVGSCGGGLGTAKPLTLADLGVSSSAGTVVPTYVQPACRKWTDAEWNELEKNFVHYDAKSAEIKLLEEWQDLRKFANCQPPKGS